VVSDPTIDRDEDIEDEDEDDDEGDDCEDVGIAYVDLIQVMILIIPFLISIPSRLCSWLLPSLS